MARVKKLNENGLIPLLLAILLIVIAVIFLAYKRVITIHR